MSPLRSSLEQIAQRLQTTPLDHAAADQCAADLSRLGGEITARIEAEFSAASDATESNAA